MPKISELPSATTVAQGDLLAIVQGGTTKSATVSQVSSGSGSIVTDTTTARVLSLTDSGSYIRMTSSSANTVSVPPSTDVAFPVATEIHIRQAGTGSTSLVAGAGVTINGSLTLTGQHATATVKKVATDTWDAIGSLE